MAFIKRVKKWSDAAAVAAAASALLKKDNPKVRGNLPKRLAEFLMSPEGQGAIRLLRAANKNVDLATVYKKRGHMELYLLTGWGFRKVNMHSGESVPCPLIPDPPVSKVSVEEVAMVLKRKYKRTSSSSRFVLRRIKSEIDRIADEVMKAS